MTMAYTSTSKAERWLIYHRRQGAAGVRTDTLIAATYGDLESAMRLARLSRITDGEVVLVRETTETRLTQLVTLAPKPAKAAK